VSPLDNEETPPAENNNFALSYFAALASLRFMGAIARPVKRLRHQRSVIANKWQDIGIRLLFVPIAAINV